MFSPAAIRDYVVTMNSIDNPVVPKFMFLLNNKSSPTNPRKEAFKFRDGIIIVSIPIYPKSNTYGCLQKVCRAFGVEPPGRWDMLLIERGITATRDVQDISDFVEDIRMRKSKSEFKRVKESERFNFTHFNTLGPFTSNVPNLSQHTRQPNPSSPDQLHGISEHVEKQFVDGTDWQDRLVRSIKMEAAKRKHITRLIEAGTFFPKEYPREADGQATQVAPVLVTRDGQTEPSALTERNRTHPETTVVRRV